MGYECITSLRKLYLQYIRTKITYPCEVWGGSAATQLKCLEKIGCPKTTSNADGIEHSTTITKPRREKLVKSPKKLVV